MPINIKYLESFQESEFMHVLAKAVGNNVLFNTDDNKIYFLHQYFAYLSGYVDTYCYCLLDNHVHWLVKCKSENELMDFLRIQNISQLKKHQREFLEGNISFERAMEYQWKDFFISYALAFNKKNGRQGTLFVNPFRRISIKDENHLIQTIVYIHANPIKHKLQSKIEDCKYTSYKSLISDDITRLCKEKILEIFGGREAFMDTHKSLINYYYINSYGME
ncbi:MAG: hypothetical protein WBP00_15060 [Saprospiraceae bacterium]